MSVNETTGDVDIQVTADASGLVAELGRAKAAEEALKAAGADAGRSIQAGMDGAEAGTKRLTAAQKAAAAAQRAAAREASAAAQEATREVGRTRAGYVNLGNQVADVAVQMQMGTNPLTILVQQGPQVASALATMGTAAIATAGAIAAAGAAVAAGYIAWRIYNEDAQRAADVAKEVAAAHEALTPILNSTKNASIDLAKELGYLTEEEAKLEHNSIRAFAALQDATAPVRKQIQALEADQRSLTGVMSSTIQEIVPAWTPLGMVVDALTTSTEEYDTRIGALRGTIIAANDATEKNVATTANLISAEIAAKDAAKGASNANREYAARLREIARIKAEMVKTVSGANANNEKVSIQAVGASIEKLDAIRTAADIQALSGIEKINEQLRVEKAEIEDLANTAQNAGADMDEVNAKSAAARVAVEAKASAEIQKIKDKEAEQAEKDAEKLRKKQIAAAEQAAQAVAGLADAAATAAGETYDHQADTANKLREQLAAGDEWYTEAQKQEMADRIRASEAAARRAFAIEKAAKLASATVNTAAAVVSALANPPGPPYSIPQSIAAGVAGGIQIAAIAGQQPAFHTGYAPDEMQARVLRSEAVVTPQGVGALGGAEAIRNANAGVNQTSSGPAYVVQVLGHDRQVLKYKKQAVRRGDAYTDAILAARVSPPWRRSR